MTLAQRLKQNDSVTDVTAPVRESSTSHRLHAADTAKGIAILFVVFGHAWRGAFGAGLLQDEALFTLVDDLIYAWHMPFFFFLSGLHFLSLAQRRQPRAFVQGRVFRLLWPLLIWTWIFFAFRLVAGSAANTPVILADFPLIPVPPYEHLWFLWALFLIQLVVFALIYLGKPLVGVTGLRWSFAGLTLGLTALFVVYYFAVQPFDLAFVHLPYFLAGAALAELSYRRPPIWARGAAVVGVGALLYAVTSGWPAVPVALGLVLLLWVLCAGLDDEREQSGLVIGVLRYLGQASMGIYLAHTVFSAAFRIALTRLDVTSVPVHLLVAMMVGIAGPLALIWCARQVRLTAFLGLA